MSFDFIFNFFDGLLDRDVVVLSLGAIYNIALVVFLLMNNNNSFLFVGFFLDWNWFEVKFVEVLDIKDVLLLNELILFSQGLLQLTNLLHLHFNQPFLFFQPRGAQRVQELSHLFI